MYAPGLLGKGHGLFLPQRWSQRVWGGCIISRGSYIKPVSGYLHQLTPFTVEETKAQTGESPSQRCIAPECRVGCEPGSPGPIPSEPPSPLSSLDSALAAYSPSPLPGNTHT